MHSTLSRLNAVSALSTTIVLTLVVFIDLFSFPSASPFTPRYQPSGNLTINQLDVVRGKAAWHMDRNIQDFIEVNFNIDADFSPLFDWNTKQVFVSLAAHYDSTKHIKNQVVIWDRILRSKQDANVAVKGGRNQYGLREVGRSFSNVKNVTFTLKYNIMPKVGLLHYGDEFVTDSITLPAKQTGSDGQQVKVQRLYY
ncbi:hypothetical protein NDA13_004444 [Ustilago tritici]|nr:hypothetical protein NDA13_004444 [Ustilago tritici]